MDLWICLDAGLRAPDVARELSCSVAGDPKPHETN